MNSVEWPGRLQRPSEGRLYRTRPGRCRNLGRWGPVGEALDTIEEILNPQAPVGDVLADNENPEMKKARSEPGFSLNVQ